MLRFILLTFVLLGWAYYELSGGGDFEPNMARSLAPDDIGTQSTPVVETEPLRTSLVEPQRPVEPVTLNLTTAQDVLDGGTTQPTRIASPLPDVDPLPDVASLEDASGLTDAVDGLPGNGVLSESTLQDAQDALNDSVILSELLPSLIENAASGGNGDETTFSLTPYAELSTLPVALTDIREVTGDRVNVRAGPGTTFEIVTRLVRGDEVQVLEEDGTGWVRMRPVNGAEDGWIADFLLSESD